VRYSVQYGYGPFITVLVICDGERDFQVATRSFWPTELGHYHFKGIDCDSQIMHHDGICYDHVICAEKGDFWLWAKCVERFKKRLPQPEPEIDEIVPCQWYDFQERETLFSRFLNFYQRRIL
jgi:hypothetical protein